MASAAQTAANRINALASTGPRTLEGKSASARNAVRHGLYASLESLAPVEREQFDEIYLHFETLYPNPESRQTLHDLAIAWFRRERVRRMEAAWFSAQIAHFANLFPEATHDQILAQTLISDGKEDNFISRLHRWDRSLSREIDRALNSLNQHRKNTPAEAESEIAGTKPTEPAQTSRNAPCPCGSGLKYKRCCLPIHERETAAAKITRMPCPEPTSAGHALP